MKRPVSTYQQPVASTNTSPGSYCLKCSEGGSADSTASQVLHNVEEKMEFARVHLQELEAKSEKPTNNVDALSEADEMLSEVGIYYLVGVDWFFLFSLI